jgi:arylsulfatase A-like enzyme
MMTCALTFSLIAFMAQSGQAVPPAAEQVLAIPKSPNILVIMADDFGVDQVGVYAEGDATCTPNIDNLASEGMLFRNAYTNPVCKPSRASIVTGQFGFRTGIGNPGRDGELDPNEVTIADLLPQYRTAFLGKWHLGGQDPNHPNLVGFDDFAGSLGGGRGQLFPVGENHQWCDRNDDHVCNRRHRQRRGHGHSKFAAAMVRGRFF